MNTVYQHMAVVEEWFRSMDMKPYEDERTGVSIVILMAILLEEEPALLKPGMTKEERDKVFATLIARTWR